MSRLRGLFEGFGAAGVQRICGRVGVRVDGRTEEQLIRDLLGRYGPGRPEQLRGLARRLTAADLREGCRIWGLSTGGGRGVLEARLAGGGGGSADDAEEVEREEMAEYDDGTLLSALCKALPEEGLERLARQAKVRVAVGGRGGVTEALCQRFGPGTPEQVRGLLTRLRAFDLRVLCKEWGVDSKGAREGLQARLMEYVEDPQGAARAVAPPPGSPEALLGVPVHASEDEVQRAWREKSKQHHPDRFAHLHPRFEELALERQKQLNAARDVLLARAQAG